MGPSVSRRAGRLTRLPVVLLAALAALPLAAAQEPPLRKPDVRWVATTDPVVDLMLKMAKVTSADVVYDLGCGDGKIVIAAARKYGARGVGIDIDPERIKEATANAKEAGVADKVRFILGDIFDSSVPIGDATVVTLFLMPRLTCCSAAAVEGAPAGHAGGLQQLRHGRLDAGANRADRQLHGLLLDHSQQVSAPIATTHASNRRDRSRSGFGAWFLAELGESPQPARPRHTAPWWQVMCLTGVDYFSTLGYQPSIAFLAAGYLSPFATLVLVLLTLFGALPVYHRIAALEPERPGQPVGARRAAAALARQGARAVPARIRRDQLRHHHHALGRRRHGAHHREPVRAALDAPPGRRDVPAARRAWRASFSRVSEAIWVAVLLVVVFLAVNIVVIGWELVQLVQHPKRARRLAAATCMATQQSPWMMVLLTMLLFPKLALGLSGFETGVAVMPLVHGDGPTDADVLRVAHRATRASC